LWLERASRSESRKQRAEGSELRGFRRQGSGFRYYFGREISNVGQFLNPEPCLLNPAS
jgi:hypothetical protein